MASEPATRNATRRQSFSARYPELNQRASNIATELKIHSSGVYTPAGSDAERTFITAPTPSRPPIKKKDEDGGGLFGAVKHLGSLVPDAFGAAADTAGAAAGLVADVAGGAASDVPGLAGGAARFLGNSVREGLNVGADATNVRFNTEPTEEDYANYNPAGVGALGNAMGALENLDRLRGANVGALSPEGSASSIVSDPVSTARRMVDGFLNPDENLGRDVIGVRGASDENKWWLLGFSARDTAGLGVDLVADPLDYVFGGSIAGGALKLTRRGVSSTRGLTALRRVAADETVEQFMHHEIPELAVRSSAPTTHPTWHRPLVASKPIGGGAGIYQDEATQYSLDLLNPNTAHMNRASILTDEAKATTRKIGTISPYSQEAERILIEFGADDAMSAAVHYGREVQAINPASEMRLIPQGTRSALEQAGHAVRSSSPIHRAFNRLLEVPANRLLDSPRRRVMQAYLADGFARARAGTLLQPSRYRLINLAEELFGGVDRVNVKLSSTAPPSRVVSEFVLDATGAKVPVPPSGTRNATQEFQTIKRAVPTEEHPLTGTMLDVFENPTHYDLTPEQAEYLTVLRERIENSRLFFNQEYGTDIPRYEGTSTQRGRTGHPAFLPHVNAKETERLRPDDELAGAVKAARDAIEHNRTYATAGERMIHDADFEPVTSLRDLLTIADEAKTGAAGQSVFARGVGGSLQHSPSHPVAVTVHGETRYFTREVADDVNHLLATSDNWVAKLADSYRQGVLAGDISPLTGIQVPMGFFMSPIQTMKQMWGGLVEAGFKPREVWDKAFSAEKFLDDVARNPDEWTEFSQMMGRPLRVSTPEEFRTGWLGAIPWLGPKINRANEAMFHLVSRMMKRSYFDNKALLRKAGYTAEEAAVGAIDDAMRQFPMINHRALGMSQRRALWERTLPTSVAFIRQPVTMMKDATAGMIKIGVKTIPGKGATTLSPQEYLAVRHAFSYTAGMTFVSGASAMFAVKDQGEEAMLEAFANAANPTHPDFWKFKLPGGYEVGMGGPYRSFAQMFMPVGNQGPGERIIPTIQSRLGPLWRIPMDLLGDNEDYLGNKIVKGEFPTNILRFLAYSVEGSSPVLVQPALANLFQRVNDSPQEIVIDMIGGLGGQNVVPPSERDTFNSTWKESFGGNPNTLSAQEISARINAAPPEVREKFLKLSDKRAETLRGRAEDGDRTAEALLIGYDTRERLERAAELATTNGTLDLADYRERRNQIKQDARAQYRKYSDVFEGFRNGGTKEQVHMAMWFDLWAQAEDAAGQVDFDRFEELEQAYIRDIGTAAYAKVQELIGEPDYRSNPAEQQLQLVRSELDRSGFFVIRDQTWTEMGQVSPQMGALTRRYGDFYQFREDWIEGRIEEVANVLKIDVRTSAGAATARKTAENDFGKHPVGKMFTQRKNYNETMWVQRHLADGLAGLALATNYLSPTKNELLAVAQSGLNSAPNRFSARTRAAG